MSITLDRKAMKMPDVQWSIEAPATMCPSWMSQDGDEIRIIDLPTREEVEYPIEDNLVVEFYSR
jgi:ribosomal protein S4